MKITSIERFILETLESKEMTYEKIKDESGLKDNVCFNTLQALVIKNIVITNGAFYSINRKLCLESVKKINSPLHKTQENNELLEHFLLTQKDSFVLTKVAMNEKDQKIFKAMLKNLESFVKDCHHSNQAEISYKERSFVFWGMTKNENIIKEIAG